MNNKVAVVTGANSGVGEVTARALAEKGAQVVMVCRNPQKGESARERIRATVPNARVQLLLGDLSVLSSVRKVAEQIRSEHEEVHVLVNNAGVYLPRRIETEEGLEGTFATNHLGPFLLTRLLTEPLARAEGARIVNVASEGHRQGRVDFSDLQSEKKYRAMGAYCASKLMNVLTASELARRLSDRGITSNSLHPGVVSTGFAQDHPGAFNRLFRLAKPFLLSAEKGARTQIYLSTSEDVAAVTGEYFSRSRRRRPSRRALDAETALRLWETSCDLADVPRED